ncbi:MAG: esterase/lipase [Nocardia sp.]|uniref:alpha/beta hydrolase n=1 Tax=Nocardia sp. TaxID=1821 RepID=UPI00260E17B3|nr:alpha/beta hydrolase [Nocardia sp.]MCU1640467.1 esterase/lipase [Nocardia sp.]
MVHRTIFGLRARIRAAFSAKEFHPDLRSVAVAMPRHMISPATLPWMRVLFQLFRLRPSAGVEVVVIDAGVRVRVHRPRTVPAGPTAALLWIHGGGYVLGLAEQDDILCRRLAQTLGIVVAAVDYRLAPEHPFPAGLEDCYSAMAWLAGRPDIDPARVAIGGASAGGGLAAALALLARDRGDIAPVLQLLTYPMLDDRTSARTDLDDSGYRVWDRRSNRFGWAAYLGDGDPEVAVPARRRDLAGVAPTWIGVGTADLFHDESVVYSERLAEADVSCRIEVIAGAFHGFDTIAPGASVSRSFFASQCEALRAALTQ